MRVINVCEVHCHKCRVGVCALSSLAAGPFLKAGTSWRFWEPGAPTVERGQDLENLA